MEQGPRRRVRTKTNGKFDDKGNERKPAGISGRPGTFDSSGPRLLDECLSFDCCLDTLLSEGGGVSIDANPGGRRLCLGVPGTPRCALRLADLVPDDPERAGEAGRAGEDGVVDCEDPSAGRKESKRSVSFCSRTQRKRSERCTLGKCSLDVEGVNVSLDVLLLEVELAERLEGAFIVRRCPATNTTLRQSLFQTDGKGERFTHTCSPVRGSRR